MDTKYAVVFRGELIAGFTRERAIANLCKAWKKETDFFRPYFSGYLKVFRKGLDRGAAETYVKTLRKMGLKAYLIDTDRLSQLSDIKRQANGAPAAKVTTPAPVAKPTSVPPPATTKATKPDGAPSTNDGASESKIVGPPPVASEKLDIPSLDAAPDVLEQLQQNNPKSRMSEWVEKNEAPKWILPADFKESDLDELTMSDVGDYIGTLHEDEDVPPPDITGLSLVEDAKD